MTDDLTTIPGVGEVLEAYLKDAGFETADQVLEADVDELTEAERVGESTARSILGDVEADYNGRPSKLDTVYDDVMDAAERGLTYEGIARVAGVGISTLNDWRDNYDDFSVALEKRRAIGEAKLVDRVAEEKPEFILERSYDYVKTERHEVDADVDQTTEHSMAGVDPDDVRGFLRYRREQADEE